MKRKVIDISWRIREEEPPTNAKWRDATPKESESFDAQMSAEERKANRASAAALKAAEDLRAYEAQQAAAAERVRKENEKYYTPAPEGSGEGETHNPGPERQIQTIFFLIVLAVLLLWFAITFVR